MSFQRQIRALISMTSTSLTETRDACAQAPATKGRATRQSIHQQFETWLQRHNWNDNSCPPPVAPGLPVLDQVISQALSKSRELRQRTAHELSQQLQHGYRPTAPSDTRASVELPSGMTAP